MPVIRILFVCLGNICRSPLAEGILKRQAKEAAVEVFVDSAAIGDWHMGQHPDPRSVRIGTEIGCDMSMRARQVRSQDFKEFDIIVAMDRMNVRDLSRWPGSDSSKVRLAMSFVPGSENLEVPDPFYGDIGDFEEVASMLEEACRGILAVVAPGR
jgi:protein-tyrosine phosphatase